MGQLHQYFAIAALAASPALADMPAPITADDYPALDPAQVELGRLLFHDKLLSGNRDISCSTCHSVDLGGTDGLSLGIGSGGMGLGPERLTENGIRRIRERIPRSAPPIWNLAHEDVSVVFHDGRLAVSDTHPSGFEGPAGDKMPLGLRNILAAQAIFPITSAAEMAGHADENEIGVAAAAGLENVWPEICDRIKANNEYAAWFIGTFDHIEHADDIKIADVANALSSYMQAEWTSFDSPFDAYLAGDAKALDDDEMRGMELFFGEAGCSTCHSGKLLTDESFHALALPQFGPGKPRKGETGAHDQGRLFKTGAPEDAYRFKTPALRNVALTGPWGHNGAYPTLRGMVEHHLDPERALAEWQPAMAELPAAAWIGDHDFLAFEDPWEMERIVAARSIEPVALTDQDVSDLVAFLQALTGETADVPRIGRPERVPSGLPID